MVGDALSRAEREVRLAEVLLAGGFPEETCRPIREALGWATGGLLALHGGEPGAGEPARAPSATLPPARLVQAVLVDPGHVPADLAARLSRVRELTVETGEGVDVPPLSAGAAGETVAAVRDLVTLGRERAAADAIGMGREGAAAR